MTERVREREAGEEYDDERERARQAEQQAPAQSAREPAEEQHDAADGAHAGDLRDREAEQQRAGGDRPGGEGAHRL